MGPDCEFDENVNYYGYDYNNGFTTLTLTPADCCRLCMRARGCHAWTRTYSGQCWLKYAIPPEADWRPVQGDVSGKRQRKQSPDPLWCSMFSADLNATCGLRFDGFFIDSWRPDEIAIPEEPVETPDECCQHCIENNCRPYPLFMLFCSL